MAVGLVDGMVTPLQFKEERVLDKALIPIMDKVKVVANDEFEALFPKFQPSRVTITTNDGKSHSTRVDVPKGDPRDPMTEDEIAVKFTALGGDAGHILLSRYVAEDLEHSAQWKPYLHELGECEVKHRVRVSVVNFYANDAGNRELPSKIKRWRDEQVAGARTAGAKRRRKIAVIGAVLILAVMACLAPLIAHRLASQRAGASTLIAEKSIAVLPFANLSADQENAFFTDGIQDEILTNLAKVADLKVISRTSVMQYKTGVKRNLREIADALGVASVVEGAVQRAGNRVRVSAQLIDARTDTHIWSEHYHRPLDDVFAIQSEIAKAIADHLQANLSPSEKNAIARPPTSDISAFDLYTRAKNLYLTAFGSSTTKADLLQVIDLLNQAVARDPAFFDAYCLLAWAHDGVYWTGIDHTPARLAKAE